MQIVSYDISSNRLRNKVAKKMLNYGKRVQYSVFECHLTKKQFEKMYAELADLTMEMRDGNIRFYTISQDDEKKIVTLGDATYVSDSEIDVLFI